MGMGLAAFATGMGAGYLNQLDKNRRNAIEDQDIAFKNEQRDRQKTEWADQDRVKAGVREADEAFRKTIESFSGPQLSRVAEPQTDVMGNEKPQMSLAPKRDVLADPNAPQPQMSVAPQGGVSPGPAPMQPVGAVPAMGKGGKPGTLNDEAPDPRLLSAMEARTNVLMQKGLIDQYKQSWMQTAEMRAKVRANEFAAADKEYALSGDPTVYAKRIYPLIEDGHDFVDGKVSTGPDGKPVMDLVRKNRETGQDETIQMPADRFLRSVEIARDPAAVIASEAAHAKKRFDTNEEIRKEQAKSAAAAEEARRTEGVKHENAKTLEGLKSANNIKEIGVRLGGERSNTAHRITLEQQAPVTLAEGQQRFAPQRREDGSIEYIPIARGGAKQPTPVKDTDISNMVINNYGTDNAVSGRKTGNEVTGRISAAARVIMKANPGLDASQAIEAAYREVNKPQGAK